MDLLKYDQFLQYCRRVRKRLQNLMPIKVELTILSLPCNGRVCIFRNYTSLGEF